MIDAWARIGHCTAKLGRNTLISLAKCSLLLEVEDVRACIMLRLDIECVAMGEGQRIAGYAAVLVYVGGT